MSEGVLRKNDRKWLESIRLATDSHVGMYPGCRVDHVPDSVAHRLRTRRGVLIEKFFPHNPVHKRRWTITRKGRRVLAEDATDA